MTTATSSTFVPTDLNPADFAQIEPLYKALLGRPINSPAELEQWLLDLSDLGATIGEYFSRLNIDKSCHTDDPEIEKRFLHFVEHVNPRLKPLSFEAQKKYLSCPHRGQGPLNTVRFHTLDREWKNEVELYRKENIPLQTEVTKLTSEYDKLCGAMLVNYRGKEITLQQLAKYQEEPDRVTREEVWMLGANRRRKDREALEAVFDQLLSLRGKMATNADCADFREYTWKSYGRFDYTPDDCLKFAESIEKTVVPLVEHIDDRRRHALGLSLLRPWDLAVDPLNRQPLRPFAQDKIDDFVSKTQTIFERISPELGSNFSQLKPGKNLDLASRKGKRPGGYQSSLEKSKEPFIFMNAAGVHRDVETMLHEAGHAFHYQAARQEPLIFLRHAPIEFCEVASMSMELLGDDHMGVFYDEADAARSKRVHLEGIIRIFPWIATIDSFQHWLYTNPGHTRAQRMEAWMGIHKRFASKLVDWSGLEDYRRFAWQAQIHVFNYPFYYVEYGIAQLGALGVWLNYRKDPGTTLRHLLAAFALGGTHPLPVLFKTAGIPFDFSHSTLEPLMDALGSEIKKLPV